MIQGFYLIARLAAHIDAQPLIELGILLRNDNGEVGVAAPQVLQLCLHHGRQRVGQPGDSQRDEHLVGVQPGVAVAQTLGLESADRLNDGGEFIPLLC